MNSSPNPEGAAPCRRGRLTQLVRVAGSSIAGCVVEFAILTVLVSLLHFQYLVGAALAAMVFIVVNFLLNRRWAFRATNGRAWPQLLRNAAVAVGGMALGTPLLWLLVSHVHLPYQVGWVMSGTTAFFGWTYPMHRFFTYRMPACAPPPGDARDGAGISGLEPI